MELLRQRTSTLTVAEMFSESDKDIIERKRGLYQAQPACRSILLVRQIAPRS